MAKQPEQILEEQLVAKSKTWDVYLVDVSPFIILKTSNIKNLILKMFTELKKGVTLAPTVPLLLPVRSAQGSFFFIGFASKSIHLFCLSLMHTEGVFSFNHNLQNV